MSGKIEKQGRRIGYIIGGIFGVILAAVLVMLYLPNLLSNLFGIEALWDLSDTFTDLLGANIMEMIGSWGVTAVLLVFILVYFVCLFARPSTSSTLFRLTALFGALALFVPALFTSLSTIIEIDLTNFGGYALFGCFIVSFVLYVAGMVARIKQKFHKNRSSTALVFAATFWMLLPFFPALSVLNGLMDANVEFFNTSGELVLGNVLGFVGIFLVIEVIWMFITVPHRIVVDYNPDTRNRNAKGRPQVAPGDGARETLTLEDLERENTTQNSYAPQMNAPQTNIPQSEAPRFAHNYTSQNTAPAFNQNTQQQPFAPQQPPRPVVQQPTQNPQYQQPQQFGANRPFVNQQNPTTPTFAQAPQNVAPTPSFTAPRPAPQNNLNVNAQNPYASFNNFAQNNPYNRQPAQPQPQQPRPAPQPMNQVNVQQSQQYAMPPRPNVPQQRPMPQQPRPAQAQRPGMPNPAQTAPRPPVTPFTSGNNPATPPTAPRPNGNGTNGTPPTGNGF